MFKKTYPGGMDMSLYRDRRIKNTWLKSRLQDMREIKQTEYFRTRIYIFEEA